MAELCSSSLLFSSIPTLQEVGKTLHEKSPLSGDQEAKGTILPIFFHSNLKIHSIKTELNANQAVIVDPSPKAWTQSFLIQGTLTGQNMSKGPRCLYKS